MKTDLQKTPRSCRLELPYPSVRLRQPDVAVGKILLGLIFARDGITDRCNYLEYCAGVLSVKMARAGQLMECMAQTEFLHRRLLCQLTAATGVAPRCGSFHRGHFRPYDAASIRYPDAPVPMLLDARRLALTGEEQYREAARRIGERETGQLLDRLARDEAHHASLIQGILSDLG